MNLSFVAAPPWNDKQPSRPRLANRRRTPGKRRGLVLPLVLIVVALLSLAAYAFSEMMLVEFQAAKVNERQAQSRTLAESGVAYLQDFLKELDDYQRQLGGRYNNPTYFQAVLAAQGEVSRDQGRFTIVSPNVEYGDLAGVRYGVEDESARININAILLADQVQTNGARTLLMALPGMTEDVADAILDWIDTDDEPRQQGAETNYYSGLGYACKNGPLDSIEELLHVRGVTPELLFGADTNRNGMVDSAEANNTSLAQATGLSSEADRGWASFLTLYSMESNVQADGTPLIDLNMSDLQQLKDDLTKVVQAEWADFIIAYRQYGPYTAQGQNNNNITTTLNVQLDYTQPGNTRINSILDLVGAKVQVTPPNPNQNQNQGQGGQSGRTSSSRRTGSFVDALGLASNVMPLALLQAGGRGGGGQAGNGGAQAGNGGGQAGNGGGQSGGGSGQGNGQNGGQTGGNQNQQQQGPILESPFPNDPGTLYSLLPQLLEYVTVNNSPTIPGRININQASELVLRGIPGMTPEIVQRIVAEREVEYSGNLLTRRYEYWLLCEGLVTLEQMKQMAPLINAGGRVFRTQVVGFFDVDGPATRLEVVINAADFVDGVANPRIVFWRDLTNLGRGYSLTTLGTAAQ
jgi:type II secretory pathway component PulK